MADLINQPSKLPTRKVTAATIAGVLTTAAVSLVDAYYPGIGQALTPALQGAITVAVTFIAAYFTRNRA